MDQKTWDSMSAAEKDKVRDLSGLTKELVGLEGWRIEVVAIDGTKERYYVSRSTGWRPCHIAVKTRRSFGGCGVSLPEGATVRKLYRRA